MHETQQAQTHASFNNRFGLDVLLVTSGLFKGASAMPDELFSDRKPTVGLFFMSFSKQGIYLNPFLREINNMGIGESTKYITMKLPQLINYIKTIIFT